MDHGHAEVGGDATMTACHEANARVLQPKFIMTLTRQLTRVTNKMRLS